MIANTLIGFGGQVFGSAHSRGQSTVDVLMVLQKDGTNDSRIDIIWTIIFDGKETPDKEHNLSLKNKSFNQIIHNFLVSFVWNWMIRVIGSDFQTLTHPSNQKICPKILLTQL